MERRAAERYYIDLPAEARLETNSASAANISSVQTRDISSAGISFYDGADWQLGEKIALEVRVGDGIVGPYSYNLKASGHIVRRETGRFEGKTVYAVVFEKGVRMSDWMEHSGQSDEEDSKVRRITGGKVDYL